MKDMFVLTKSFVNKGVYALRRPLRQTCWIALFGSLAIGCGSQPGQPGELGAVAPAYSAAALSGDSVSLGRLRGSVVLLNVWATWCIPCRREIPELQGLHQEYSGRGLKVVGVSVDDAADGADVAEFIGNYSVTYLILRDPADRISTLFRTPGIPSSFLIDRVGVVRWRHVGAFTSTDPTFREALQKTL